VQLSEHFALSEFTRTQVDLPNEPTLLHVERMRLLCTLVLEPFRQRVGRLKVTSGCRSPQVNVALAALGYKASKTSQHMRGEAADVRPLDMPLPAAWGALLALRAVLPIDQAIVYVREPGKGWLHLSFADKPRDDFRVDIPGQKQTVPWSAYRGNLTL
jgi:hypothetical protein